MRKKMFAIITTVLLLINMTSVVSAIEDVSSISVNTTNFIKLHKGDANLPPAGSTIYAILTASGEAIFGASATEVSPGVYGMPLVRQNDSWWGVDDVKEFASTHISCFLINGIHHSIDFNSQDGTDIGLGTEGGGTVNYWLNKLIIPVTTTTTEPTTTVTVTETEPTETTTTTTVTTTTPTTTVTVTETEPTETTTTTTVTETESTTTTTTTTTMTQTEETTRVPKTTSPPKTTRREKLDEYTLTLGSTDGGDFDLFEGSMDFADGTMVNVSYSVDEGYQFVGYSSESDDSDITGGKIKMNEDKELFAIFEPIPVPTTTVEIILEEDTPQAAPEDIPDEVLPQTGGIPIQVLSLVGTAVAGLGVKIRKRNL